MEKKDGKPHNPNLTEETELPGIEGLPDFGDASEFFAKSQSLPTEVTEKLASAAEGILNKDKKDTPSASKTRPKIFDFRTGEPIKETSKEEKPKEETPESIEEKEKEKQAHSDMQAYQNLLKYIQSQAATGFSKGVSPSSGHPAHTSPNLASHGENLVSAGSAMVSGVAGLAGVTMRGIGKTATVLTELTNQALDIGTLPKISNYRVSQLEKSAANYSENIKKFWASGSMADVLKSAFTASEKNNIPVQRVIQNLNDYPEIKAQYVSALEDPATHELKKVVDKNLTSWLKQHSKSVEERLSLKTNNKPSEFETDLEDRVQKTEVSMKSESALLPADEEGKSHAAEVQNSIKKLAERIAEFIKALRSKFSGSDNESQSPSP